MKKVLQSFFGKITILVLLLFAFAYTGNGQAHITMSTANCTITANEVQMDIMLTNDGTQDLRWNSCVLRMVVPAGMLPVGGTYSFQCVGAGDFPLSWPAVLPANAFGASYNAGTRTITWTTGNTSAYNNLTCTAPLVPLGATRTIGRFSFKCTSGNFVAGQAATFTWSATSSCNLYQTSPTCATAVTGFSTTTLRTLGSPCILTVPSSCAVTGVAVTTPVCGAATNGTATVTLSGAGAGAPGNYTVDGGPSTPYATNPFTVTGLSGGAHTIVATVTAGGCVSSNISANVVSNPNPIVSISNNNGLALNCLVTSTTLTANGGDGGASYLWSPGNETTQSITVSTAGSWSVLVTNSTGCTGTANVSTTLDNTPPNAQITSNNGLALNCTVTSTTLTASGGTGYLWSPGGETTASKTVTTAGIWSVTVTGANGCTASTSATTTLNNTPPTVSFSGLNGPYCSDAGAVTLTGSPAGGTFSGPGITGNSFDPSAAGPGTHSISYSYTDPSTGCSNSSSQSVTVNPAVSGSGTTTAVSCFGATDGTATITVTGATSGTYTVDLGAPQPFNASPFTITGLAAGNHTVVVSSGGCSSGLIGVNVGSTAALTGTGTTTPTTCGNPTSGTATITLSGSTSGNYTLDGGSSTAYNSNPFTITGLTAGSHTIIATSAAGCVSNNIVVNVGSNAAFNATFVKTNLTACGVSPDGSITVTPSGGTGPYQYAWTGQTGSNQTPFTAGNVSSLTGLNYGFYNVTVTDLGGCGSVTLTNIHVQFAYYVYITNSGTSSSACGNTGSIILYGNAGVTPYTYALSPGSGQPTPAPGAFQTSNTFTGLAAGSYTAFVKDAGGCVSAKDVTVSSAPAIVVNPFAIGASSCAADGSVQIFKTGGTPGFTYALSAGSGQPTPAPGAFQTSNFFGALASGSYTAFVKDGTGCVGQANTTVAAGTGISATVSKINTSSCVNDGTIQVNATGGVAPYTYSLNGAAFQASNAFGNLAAGNYTVQVKDSKGCLSATINVTISVNTITVTYSATAATSCAANNGKIQLFKSGGYGPFTYSIDGNIYQSSPLFTGVAAGTYTGYVKDSKTCIGFVTGIVVGPTGCPPPPIATTTKGTVAPVQPKAELRINAYPNPSTSAFTLALEGYSNTEKVSITVTDLLGRKVYQTETLGKQQHIFGANFKTGMYNVQVMQGASKASLKLVKE